MALTFEKLEVYKLAEQLADFAWTVVTRWDRFSKDTIGKQLVRAADGIGANIAEGFGRGSFNDNKRFVKIARGSLYETRHWLRRAYRRELLQEQDVRSLRPLLDQLSPRLNAYLRAIGIQQTRGAATASRTAKGQMTKDKGQRTRSNA